MEGKEAMTDPDARLRRALDPQDLHNLAAEVAMQCEEALRYTPDLPLRLAAIPVLKSAFNFVAKEAQAVLAAPAEPPQQDQLAEIRARHAGGREWNSQNLHWADQAERDRGKLLALVDSQVADLARLREANETLTQENARLRGLLLAGRSDEGH
jgi:hypothetical protein